jgi:lambda repressor-like predicted transcriptional regulator
VNGDPDRSNSDTVYHEGQMTITSGNQEAAKSLRQLARELGVSASYLSQVRHGKCPPSKRLLHMLGALGYGFGDLKPVTPQSLCGFESRPRHFA